MIIDSHAHYSHSLYDGDFSYLDWQQGEFCIRQGNRQLMLEEIITLLRQGVSVREASQRLCFSSPENFSRFFKSEFGCSPTEYVKRFRHLPL